MNKSSLALTGKLNQERFSANLTLSWSSAVYLKLTIGKIFDLACAGAIEAGDERYFCHVREDMAWALFEF